MKKLIVIIGLLVLCSISLWGERVKFGSGYSPTSETVLFMASLPMDGMSEKIDGNLYVKMNWMKRKHPEGLEISSTVWGWQEKDSAILDVMILSLGYSTNILWKNKIYLSPNIGFGHSSKYIQYQQTEIPHSLYYVGDRFFSDPGIDLSLFIDDLGITVGTSMFSCLQLGIMIRF